MCGVGFSNPVHSFGVLTDVQFEKNRIVLKIKMFCKMNLSENKTNGTGDGLTAAGIRSGVDNYTFVVDSNAALLA
jgi:hypothetical protein